MFSAIRFTSRVPLRSVRWDSTGPVLPPLMATMRNDLKTAMRAKDVSRLNVLRALISETNNAAKSPKPIQTDVQLLSLMQKRIAAAEEAAKQFAEEDRVDLMEKEQAQVAILQEYASQIPTLSAVEVEAIVAKAIDSVKHAGDQLREGIVLKTLFSKGSDLDGQPVDRNYVVRVVQKALRDQQ